MGDILSYYQDRVANESFLGTAQQRRSVIQHLRLIGYQLSTAAPASATLTLTVPVERTDIITINRGDAFATRTQRDAPPVRFEYTREQPLRIDCRVLPTNAATNRKYYHGIRSRRGAGAGGDPGHLGRHPNQRFPLAHTGLILRSLGQGQAIQRDILLLTDLGGILEEWTLQESLAFNREGQKDFMVEIDEDDRASVLFGDGAFGAIPPNDAVIKATYRVGGGLHGNLAPHMIQTIIEAPQLVVLGAQITNPMPATGGAERESVAHAVTHAPSVFRSLKRAVTAEDDEALALDFKGVGKVRAEATNWNTVKLIVAQQGGGEVSDVLRANLLAYFEDKRPISTMIDIADADYKQISSPPR